MSSTAKVSVYALTVHSRSWTVAPRSCRIEGSATVTMRLSSAVMKSAAETTRRVRRAEDMGGSR